MRTPVARKIEKDVLVTSRRRCCLCVFLLGRDEVRKGQIAHLNRDAEDSSFENLVYLCLEHHDDYDSKASQSKGFSEQEVREYRDRLYSRFHTPSGVLLPGNLDTDAADLIPLAETSQYELLRARFDNELGFTSVPWRYGFWQVANEPEFFAYKAGNRADGVCLIERVDLPDGRIVIACIETAGNPGQSITNCVEELCFQVCERFEIPAERLVWLEHYDYYEPAEWNMVIFGQRPPDSPFRDPQWTTMTPELWRELRLKPRRHLKSWRGQYSSKLTKLFHWPTQGIL